MKTQQYLFLLSIICLSFILVRCGKDGAVGPQGNPGDKGANGINGNANVKVDTFTVKGSEWINGGKYVLRISPYNAIAWYTTKYVVHNNTLITNDLLKTGMILVYFQPEPVDYSGNWQPLPYVYEDSPTFNWVFETAVGKVTLHFFFSNVKTDPHLNTYIPATTKYKIVLVTGTIMSSIKQNHININNYNEVSRFLSIQ